MLKNTIQHLQAKEQTQLLTLDKYKKVIEEKNNRLALTQEDKQTLVQDKERLEQLLLESQEKIENQRKVKNLLKLELNDSKVRRLIDACRRRLTHIMLTCHGMV